MAKPSGEKRCRSETSTRCRREVWFLRRFWVFCAALGGLLSSLLFQNVFATTYVINDGGRTFSCTVYQDNAQAALAAAGVELSPADEYTLEADTITVRRAPTMELIYHGRSQRVQIGEETVEQLLTRLSVPLEDTDVLSHPRDAEVYRGMVLRVDRLESREESFVREIPYETTVAYAPDLPQGIRETLTQGKNGTLQCRAWVTYTNGVETGREILAERQTAPAVTEVIALGTGAPVEKASAPQIGDGVILLPTGERLTYTKVDYVRATAYTHTDEGCTTTTATGTTVRRGTVAVDPRYIPYGTRMFIVASDGSYVYGLAQAEDCGGDIKGDRMDLYLPTYDDCIAFGRRRCTVYFLG